MRDLTRHLLNAAEDDLKVIGLIIDRSDLTHLSAFHSQQAIEKCFKSVIEEFHIKLSRTHNLEFLYSNIKKLVSINIDIKILSELDALYIDSRYPGALGLLPSGKPSLQDAKSFYLTAKEIQSTITNFIEK
ncbi:MAG: HEPN domain-containing protein [Bacteroidetes bacterium]|nr:HEPN domain-containing protein [Bacteroidota bacterium]